MNKTSIVLLSGGIDSAVCMAEAVTAGEEVYSVYCNYGQRNHEYAVGMAQEQHKFWAQDINHWYQLDLTGSIREICERNGGFGIVGDTELENEDGSVTRDDGRGLQYVPMRNLTMLTQAGALADVVDADYVYFGAQAWNEDVAPDARPEFVEAAERALTLSMADGEAVSIETPIIDMTKPEAVYWGDTLGVPWQHTWSCYEMPEDWENPEPCGNCHSCKERAAAFHEIGISDPHGTPEIVPNEEMGVQT